MDATMCEIRRKIFRVKVSQFQKGNMRHLVKHPISLENLNLYLYAD